MASGRIVPVGYFREKSRVTIHPRSAETYFLANVTQHPDMLTLTSPAMSNG